jgi:hypothetical protein
VVCEPPTFYLSSWQLQTIAVNTSSIGVLFPGSASFELIPSAPPGKDVQLSLAPPPGFRVVGGNLVVIKEGTLRTVVEVVAESRIDVPANITISSSSSADLRFEGVTPSVTGIPIYSTLPGTVTIIDRNRQGHSVLMVFST